MMCIELMEIGETYDASVVVKFIAARKEGGKEGNVNSIVF